MNIFGLSELLSALLVIGTFLSAVAALVVKLRPKWRKATGRVGAALDTIAGRPEITDNITGAVLAPALPSVGMRLGTLEESVSRLVEAEIERQQIDQRVTDAHDRIDAHEARLRQLEEQTIERIAAKAESVSAWRAVEAVAKQADPIGPEIQD